MKSQQEHTEIQAAAIEIVINNCKEIIKYKKRTKLHIGLSNDTNMDKRNTCNNQRHAE